MFTKTVELSNYSKNNKKYNVSAVWFQQQDKFHTTIEEKDNVATKQVPPKVLQ